MSRHGLLLAQLNALLRLTQTEQTVTQTRRAQAATADIERQLGDIVDECAQRADLLAESIRSLGQAPDVLGVAVGRIGATLKTAVEQGQDLDELLLGDLALEHQLLDRARFARMLAEQLSETSVAGTLERVEVAHTTTIEWLMDRLGEIAVGGPVSLRPTPMEAFVGFGRRVGQLPARQTAGAVNRSVESARRARDRTSEVVSTNVARTRQLVEAASEIWTAGRDASLKRSEELAVERGTANRPPRCTAPGASLAPLKRRSCPCAATTR